MIVGGVLGGGIFLGARITFAIAGAGLGYRRGKRREGERNPIPDSSELGNVPPIWAEVAARVRRDVAWKVETSYGGDVR